jgi:TRAP-type mannitol/chloroaromatic compound transport system permease small subunit
MRKIVYLIDAFNAWVGRLISFIMMPIMAIICYEVAMRYIFHRPTIWASEAMTYGCALLYVIGAAWTLLENRHVKIDFLYEKFSHRKQRTLDCITFPFFALYMGLLLWVGSKFAYESLMLTESSGTPWNPPVYPIKIAFVVGVVMLSAQGISKFMKDLYFVIHGKEL